MTCLMTERRQGSLQIFEGYKYSGGTKSILKARREKPTPLGLIEPNEKRGEKLNIRKYFKMRIIIF